MSRPIPEGVENCPRCKAVLANGWNRCGMCGHRKETLLSKFARTHNEGTTSSVAVEDLNDPDKDALIRELIKAGTFLRQDLEIELTDRGKGIDKWCSLLEWESALTLARTTCPEAFDWCNETPADGR